MKKLMFYCALFKKTFKWNRGPTLTVLRANFWGEFQGLTLLCYLDHLLLKAIYAVLCKADLFYCFDSSALGRFILSIST